MKKNTRNILLAVILLVVLAVLPFWPNLRQAIGGEKTDGEGPSVQCTVEVRCKDLALVPELQQAGIAVEEDGVLFSGSVAVPMESTVLAALEQAGKDNGLAVVTQGSPAYVTAIGGLAAGEHGDLSGWTYTVNGEMVMDSCAVKTVQEGDEILWTYVTSWE